MISPAAAARAHSQAGEMGSRSRGGWAVSNGGAGRVDSGRSLGALAAASARLPAVGQVSKVS